MTDLLEKRNLLRTAGYNYNFDREVYVNRGDRKVFSLEFVEDHDQNELRQRIAETNASGWRFYFNEQPPPGIQRELESLLGG